MSTPEAERAAAAQRTLDSGFLVWDELGFNANVFIDSLVRNVPIAKHTAG